MKILIGQTHMQHRHVGSTSKSRSDSNLSVRLNEVRSFVLGITRNIYYRAGLGRLQGFARQHLNIKLHIAKHIFLTFPTFKFVFHSLIATQSTPYIQRLLEKYNPVGRPHQNECSHPPLQ